MHQQDIIRFEKNNHNLINTNFKGNNLMKVLIILNESKSELWIMRIKCTRSNQKLQTGWWWSDPGT
jgi:hypothetical protein